MKRLFTYFLCFGLLLGGCTQKTEGVEKKTESVQQTKEIKETKDESFQLKKDVEDFLIDNYEDSENVAIGIQIVDEKALTDINSHKMQAASLIKLYIAGCIYENMETIDEPTQQMLVQMITISDNTACNNLIDLLGNGDTEAGKARVNLYCENHGFEDTHLGRKMMESNDVDDNYTSVKDCTTFLSMIYHKKLPGSEEILDLMKKQERKNKIPAGIPEGIETGNKTGELADVENDVAIIFSDRPYILCVMTEKAANPGAAREFIIHLSTYVYEQVNT